MQEITWLVEEMSVPQKGLGLFELVNCDQLIKKVSESEGVGMAM
jgi:hypothetical protein